MYKYLQNHHQGENQNSLSIPERSPFISTQHQHMGTQVTRAAVKAGPSPVRTPAMGK